MDPFRFKHFDCRHEKSTIKIGVDAVLLGCWADFTESGRILDVGTGCGVIAMIAAQRNLKARIFAIDVDPASIDEATCNFSICPWSDRLDAQVRSFDPEFCGNYDHLISNPPYFDSGIKLPETRRLAGRHQGVLSPISLFKNGTNLLSGNGKITLIAPADQAEEILGCAKSCGFQISRKALVRGLPHKPFKRIMIEACKATDCNDAETPITELLTLEDKPGVPTEEYRSLCKDFYLKF